VFFEAIALFSIIQNIAQLGSDDGLVRFVPRLRELGRTRDLRRTLNLALWPAAAVGALFGLLTFAFAPQISGLFVQAHSKIGSDALVPYIRLMAAFLPIAAVSNPLLAATRGFGTMLPTVTVDNFGKPGIRPVLAYLVIAAGLGATALALSWAILIPAGVAVALYWLMELVQRAESTDRVRMRHRTPRAKVFGEFWAFAAPRGVAAIFSITVYWLDTLLLGGLKGPQEAGIYTAASRYLFVGWFALGAVQQVIAPMISGLLTRGDRERAQAVYQTGTHWLMSASWPVFFTLAVFAPFLLNVFRPQYVAGQHALMILALAMLFNSAAGPVMVTLLMAGKSSWALLNSAAGLTVNVGLNLLLIPRLGMTGAALAWSASIVTINALALYQVGARLKLRPIGRGFGVVALASAVCFGGGGLLVRLVLGMSWWSFLLFGFGATALYLGTLYRYRRALHLDVLRQGMRMRRQRMEERARRVPGRA
jgi:O-antigen/teichoic acid export membrane protein